MKINVTHTEKLDKAFTEANGKCTARLANSSNAVLACKQIEYSLETKGIPKCMWSGLRFSVQPGAEVLPNSYYMKGTPEATSFKLERSSTTWFVVDIKRVPLLSRKIIMVSLFTKEQEYSIISNACKF